MHRGGRGGDPQPLGCSGRVGHGHILVLPNRVRACAWSPSGACELVQQQHEHRLLHATEVCGSVCVGVAKTPILRTYNLPRHTPSSSTLGFFNLSGV
jgi:hypothetical protein